LGFVSLGSGMEVGSEEGLERRGGGIKRGMGLAFDFFVGDAEREF